jgi:hypothetical protein
MAAIETEGLVKVYRSRTAPLAVRRYCAIER